MLLLPENLELSFGVITNFWKNLKFNFFIFFTILDQFSSRNRVVLSQILKNTCRCPKILLILTGAYLGEAVGGRQDLLPLLCLPSLLNYLLIIRQSQSPLILRVPISQRDPRCEHILRPYSNVDWTSRIKVYRTYLLQDVIRNLR